MIEDSTLKVGGSKFRHWLGKKIQNLGNRLVEKGKPSVVTNPTCKLVNPFTLLISFTVDGSDKYQVVLQGNYKEHYKESEDYVPDIKERELFMLIHQSHKSWYKKS